MVEEILKHADFFSTILFIRECFIEMASYNIFFPRSCRLKLLLK